MGSRFPNPPLPLPISPRPRPAPSLPKPRADSAPHGSPPAPETSPSAPPQANSAQPAGETPPNLPLSTSPGANPGRDAYPDAHPDPNPDANPEPPALTDREAQLLDALLAADLDLLAFAKAQNLTAQQLLAFQRSAAVQRAMQDLDQLAEQLLTIRLKRAQAAAAARLESLATTAEDPIESRRAAATLMRAGRAPRHRCPDCQARRSPTDAPDPPPGCSSSRHGPPAPRFVPDPLYSAEDVARLALRALQHNNAPRRHTGYATLHALLAPGAVANNRPLPDDLDTLIAAAPGTVVGDMARTVQILSGKTRSRTRDEAAFDWTIVRDDGECRFLTLSLVRTPDADGAAAWRIAAIETRPPPEK